MRALSFELATQLAACDARCAQMVLGALVQHHAQSMLHVAVESSGEGSGARRPPELQPVYYDFVAGLLYASLNNHLHDPIVVPSAIRLALHLAVRSPATRVLPHPGPC